MVELLIEQGADIESTDNDGLNPLAIAVIEGVGRVVRVLVDKGSGRGNKDENGQDAIIAGCVDGAFRNCSALGRAGCQLDGDRQHRDRTGDRRSART